MPDTSGRIKKSAIDSMCTMLLSLTSLYEDADLSNHPRMCVIFNNVSKISHPKKTAPVYGPAEFEPTEVEDIQVDVDEESSKKSSEESSEEHVDWEEYIKLYRDLLIETLHHFYNDKLSKTFIESRIRQLFPDSNFYFYQMRNDEGEMFLEWAQMELFIQDNIESRRFYIKSGLLEPVHL